jgi:hypothetical protein
MKLVEILAKELGEWPSDCAHGCDSITQDASGAINTTDVGKVPVFCVDSDIWLSGSSTFLAGESGCVTLDIATDHATAIVTREMWQAERDKQSCERVEEVAAEHLACIAKDSCNVILMRDRIREIDATIEAMTAERAELVSKLAGEGFALIAVAAEPVEDMSDWRNWKAGDILSVLDIDGEYHGFDVGGNVKMLTHDTNRGKPAPYCESLSGLTKGWVMAENLKFHSRPTA